MATPKFANTTNQTRRRPTQTSEESLENVMKSEEVTPTLAIPSISEFMQQQMKTKEREPTRPITLRFEESLWKKVETLRGGLSKNDFFKELVAYYDKSQN